MTSPPLPFIPRTILVGVDYSAESSNAAQHALTLAQRLGARVHLVHAWAAPYAPTSGEVAAETDPNHPDLLALVRRSAEERMAQFQATLDSSGTAVTTSVESGDARTVLLHHAETHACDWIVLGRRSRSAVAEWFLGNVAGYVVRHCQVPVLVVPNPQSA